MTTVVSFVVVIGVLILIHELGHFVIARLTGVGVERFSIGFGPVLLRWRGKETEYCLSAVPMGGYVKMVGEENPLEGGRSEHSDPTKAFALKPLWARFLIVFAGPAMNLVLAAVIAVVVLGTIGRPVWPPVIGRVADGGPAAAAGLRSGDTITTVNGRRAAHWEDVEQAIVRADGRPLSLEVRRDGAVQTVTLTPRRTTIEDPVLKDERTVWDIGAGPQSIPSISSVSPNSPAAAAGLEPGDRVVAVDGRRVFTADELVQAIRKRPGTTFPITIDRRGKTLTVSVTPHADVERNASGEEIHVGRIQAGIASAAVGFERYPPLTALRHGIVWTKDMIILTARGIWKIAVGSISRSNIGGPIQIASEAGRQAHEGLGAIAMFTAIISVNLGILNLLPVPMLDGGHLLFFVIEGVRGRPLSLRKREAAQQLGFVLLMLLMVYAIYNDLVRIDAFKIFRQ